MKYRFLEKGEWVRKLDRVKHHCGCYWYETKDGVTRRHKVEIECADFKCYKRKMEEDKK